MASSSIAQGSAGLQLSKTSKLVSNSPIESGSLTPRVRNRTTGNTVVYKGDDNIEITRYLINRSIDDPANAEIDALDRAINHIKDPTIDSSKQLTTTAASPRTISKSNVVLI